MQSPELLATPVPGLQKIDQDASFPVTEASTTYFNQASLCEGEGISQGFNIAQYV
ncbi:MAG: hypothetical protein WKF70_05795 [Chitinophagaceae bacterium]